MIVQITHRDLFNHIKSHFLGAEGGHDLNHTLRVLNNAQQIARTLEVNHQVLELGALLHDIADAKFYDGDETVGPKVAKTILEEFEIATEIKEHVVKIVKNISFKNSLEKPTWYSLELAILQDADRLDAIGAIGIARAFNYGGFKGRSFYDFDIPPNMSLTKEVYKNSTSPTLNHFYEKLLTLKENMNTEEGKRMAKQRHEFMISFLDQFYSEIGRIPSWHN